MSDQAALDLGTAAAHCKLVTGDAASPDFPRVIAEAVIKAAEASIRAAERERIYAELGNDHYVIFTQDRWTIEHSVECRLGGHMPQCAYHEAIALIADEPRPETLGRWRISEIDSEGLPSLERPGGES